MVRVSFTREGWYCLFVIIFVLGGAALREVNLLILLAGLMIGPLVFHWRLVTLMLRKVDVTRVVCQRVRAGDVLRASVQVTNGRRFLDCWAVVVRDKIQLVGGGKEDRATVDVLVPHVPPQSEEQGVYQATLTRRGRYVLGPLQLTTRFPLGLISARLRVDCPAPLIVSPRIGQLTLQWRQLVNSERVGAEQTRAQKGITEQGEFFGLREWRPGDAQRLVHWRTSAKLGALAVRQFEQPQHRDLVVLVDLWQPGTASAGGVDPRVAIETAISFAATIVEDIARGGPVKLSFAIVGAAAHAWSGMASVLMAEEILDCLAEVQPGSGQQRESVFEEMLQKRRHERSLIVISTRPRQDATRALAAANRRNPAEIDWIDTSAGDQEAYFHLVDRSTVVAMPSTKDPNGSRPRPEPSEVPRR